MRSKGKSAIANVDMAHSAVSRLRFPGFKKGWQFVPLSKLASRSMLRNSDEQEKRVLTNSAEHGIVDQRDYFDKDIADKGNLQNYYVVKLGDYVYNPRISSTAPVGPISRNEIGTGVMSPLYMVFRLHSNKSDFFTYFFKSSRWHGFLRENSSTGARHDRMSIGSDVFMGMPVPNIDPGEQAKIAGCLSSLDACIGVETRKLDALQAHKQGLMQQLFPVEGQCLPRLRFPGFKGKWGQAPVGGRIETVTPPKKLQTSQYMDRGSYPIIDQSQDPVAGWTDDVESLVNGPFPLIVFGDHTCTLKLTKKPFAQGADGIRIFNAKEGVTTEYLYQYLQIRPLVMQDYRRHFSILKERTVKFPLEMSEQMRISEFLSSLDGLVDAQSHKIAALQQHKKGLMQGLFPAMSTDAA